MTKTPLASLLLAGALAALGVTAAPAQAATAKFIATYTGTLQTDWSQPRYQFGTATCFRVPWRQAQGSETWQVKSRGKGAKVVVSGKGRNLQWRSGTHSMTGEAGEFRAGGLIERANVSTSGWEAGRCEGATAGVDPPRPNDCGTLLPSYDLGLSTSTRPGGGLVVRLMQPGAARDEKRVYGSCPLPMPDELTPGAWPDEPGPVSTKTIFGSSRTVTVKGRKQWSQVLFPGRAGEATTKTTLRWTLRLRRVRR